MNDGLFSIFKDISANIQVLVISGLLGALARAVVAPEQQWRRRLGQGLVGVIAATCLGPLLAEALTGFVEKDVYAWLAAGCSCGFAGEAAMTFLQNRVLGGKK